MLVSGRCVCILLFCVVVGVRNETLTPHPSEEEGGHHTRAHAHNFNDPIYHQQSHLATYHIQDVWAMGYTGSGVNIAFIVEQADEDNPDLAHHSPLSAIGNPTAYVNATPHDTSVISAVCAQANNGFCSVGIAYKANPLIFEVTYFSFQFTAPTLGVINTHQLNAVDIYLDTTPRVAVNGVVHVPANVIKSYEVGVTHGRNGGGAVYIAAVSSDRHCDADEYTALREIIKVGYYNEENAAEVNHPCSAILIVAPTHVCHIVSLWSVTTMNVN